MVRQCCATASRCPIASSLVSPSSPSKSVLIWRYGRGGQLRTDEPPSARSCRTQGVLRLDRHHEIDLLYDVSHNLAKIETHDIDGTPRQLCVHRKGATRALPPGHTDLRADLREVGQPVLVAGSMGTASYVLAGVHLGAPSSRPAVELDVH
jgi:hypothetical protein